MSMMDKLRNLAEKAMGKGQQAKGQATGDQGEELRGRTTQAKSDVKQAAEKLKDATHE